MFCTGVSFGGCWALVPILVAESFPRPIFGITWAWLASSPPIASLIFNAYVGVLYDRQADAEHNCVGRKCWVEAFGVGMAISAVAVVVSLVMLRYSKVGKEAAAAKVDSNTRLQGQGEEHDSKTRQSP